jgi:hypothetical protein
MAAAVNGLEIRYNIFIHVTKKHFEYKQLFLNKITRYFPWENMLLTFIIDLFINIIIAFDVSSDEAK